MLAHYHCPLTSVRKLSAILSVVRCAVCDAVMAAGFSVESVAFGMGGGLLQKVNRDTMAFATKLSFIIDADGRERNIMKRPKHEGSKASLPGLLRVVAAEQKGALKVIPASWNREKKRSEGEGDSVMRSVWDYGPVAGCWDDFDVLRERVEKQWAEAPAVYDVVSSELKAKVDEWVREFNEREERKLDWQHGKSTANGGVEQLASAAGSG